MRHGNGQQAQPPQPAERAESALRGVVIKLKDVLMMWWLYHRGWLDTVVLRYFNTCFFVVFFPPLEY